MTINNRLLAVVMIAATWLLTAIVVALSTQNLNTNPMLLMTAIAIFLAGTVTYGILGAYERRSERVNKLMNTLDERDLDLLRQRLAYQEGDDGEYELLNSPKRKNG
jgi:FlaG/FlaF family flagellin (archaellin)